MAIDKGAGLTDERMKTLDKRLQEIYSEAHKTAVSREKEAIAELAAFDVAKLKEKGLSDTAIRTEQLLHKTQVERATQITKNIAAEITKSGKTAAKMIQNEMLNIYGLNLDWAEYDIDRQAGVLFNWQIYDKNQLKVLLDSKQAPFTKIAYDRLGIDAKKAEKVIVPRLQNALTQAVVLGESQQQIIGRIREVTGQSQRQARTVAQTERNRVQSQARFQGIEEASSMGIAMQKQWISRMNSAVRDSHADITGEIVDYDKTFGNGLMFPGDPSGKAEEVVNCHCVLKPMVKNVPESVKRHREQMAQNYGFEEWREERAEQDGRKSATLGGKKEMQLYNYEQIAPEQINPVNPITDHDKFFALAYDFSQNGYEGRPIVAIDMGDNFYQALTGSHRTFAAREAGIDIPTKIIPYNPKLEDLINASGDEDRLQIANDLYKKKLIDKESLNLLSREMDINIADMNSATEKMVAQKAEMYKLQAAQQKAMQEEAAKAAAKYEAEQAAIVKKAREMSVEMAEYKAYLAEMEEKYKNIWAEMTDAEMSKISRLETLAYKGR